MFLIPMFQFRTVKSLYRFKNLFYNFKFANKPPILKQNVYCYWFVIDKLKIKKRNKIFIHTSGLQSIYAVNRKPLFSKNTLALKFMNIYIYITCL